MGYAKPQAIVYLALGALAVVVPLAMSLRAETQAGSLEAAAVLVCTSVLYLVFVCGMSYWGWFSNETIVRRRWEELERRDSDRPPVDA